MISEFVLISNDDATVFIIYKKTYNILFREPKIYLCFQTETKIKKSYIIMIVIIKNIKTFFFIAFIKDLSFSKKNAGLIYCNYPI